MYFENFAFQFLVKMNRHSSPNGRTFLADADPHLQLLASHLSAATSAPLPPNELLGQHLLLNSSPQQQLEMMNMFAASRAGLVKPVGMITGPKGNMMVQKHFHPSSMDMVNSGQQQQQQQQQLSNLQAFIAVNLLRIQSNAAAAIAANTQNPFNLNMAVNLNSNLVTLANHHHHNMNNQSAKRSPPASEPVAVTASSAGVKGSSKRFDYSKLVQECVPIKDNEANAAANRKPFAGGDNFNASGELKSSKKTSKR